jgi:predicted phosphodiesterase
MLNDFEMITHEFNHPISIFPISDVHYGTLGHLKKEWLDFCKMVERTDNVYLILGGDMINNNTRSSVGSPWEDTVRPREQKNQMVEMLKPLAENGRILCNVPGNHEMRSAKDCDDDPNYDIMCKLDLEDIYRQDTAFMKVSLGHRKNDNTPIQSYTFAVNHGSGSGGTTGAAINKAESFSRNIDGLDCFVVGHTHKGAVTKPSKIVIDRKNNKVTTVPFTVVSMVSWLNYGGYALRSMLLPSHVADPQRLNLAMNQHRKRIEVVW